MSKPITMEDLEAINFPYYYNLVKEGKIKAKEVKDLLFNGNPNKYRRYRNVMEGKQAIPQKTLDKMKEYYQINKEYYKKYKKEYYEANKEYYKKYKKEYMKTPEGKEAFKRANHKREALKLGNGGSYTQEQWNQCLEYFNHCDAYTGEPLESTEIEHVIPLSKGGTSNIYNIVPANRSTNASKHNSDVFEWYSKQPYFSWDRYIKICLWIIKKGVDLFDKIQIICDDRLEE